MNTLARLLGRWLALITLGLSLTAGGTAAWAQAAGSAGANVASPGDGGVLPIPALTERVIDQTSTLSAAQRQALVAQLAAIEQQHGSQVVILLVPSTQPEDIAAYAWRVADTWKIGRKTVGDGVLLIVAKNDRTVRIEVARALEGAIPDLAASRIIEGAITPAFRNGDFAGGIQAGVEQIGKLIAGESLPPPKASGRPAGDIDLNQLLVFGLFGVPVISGILGGLLGRKLGAATTGALGGGLVWLVTTSLLMGGVGAFLAFVLALSMGHGGGRHGGWGGPPRRGGWGGGGFGGGGGFSSGGGGSFGGGGASGRW